MDLVKLIENRCSSTKARFRMFLKRNAVHSLPGKPYCETLINNLFPISLCYPVLKLGTGKCTISSAPTGIRAILLPSVYSMFSTSHRMWSSGSSSQTHVLNLSMQVVPLMLKYLKLTMYVIACRAGSLISYTHPLILPIF